MIDASAALAWLLPRQATPATARFLKESSVSVRQWEAPFVFGWEVDNALIRLLQARRLSADAYDKARSQLDLYEIKLGPAYGSEAVMGLAQTAGLSLFDAAYLDHALQNHCELASRDRELLSAARRRGVTAHDLSAQGET